MTTTISLSLVSHTNAGKTTLARTLLGREVGIVRDEAHVTEVSESHELIRGPDGARLLLWDTPGFGDSLRLARRLEASENPLAWVVGSVWDRLRDRPLWSSQQALRHVREETDVVLYLVNAAEDPADASYVEPEMRILAWTGKPVVVLLNQMGPPKPVEQERADLLRWREHLAAWPLVKGVLALDAFARCWVQEDELLKQVTSWIDDTKRPAFERLRQQWRDLHRARLEQSANLLAGNLVAATGDRIVLPAPGLQGQLRQVGKSLGLPGGSSQTARDDAMVELAKRWDQRARETTTRLLELNSLTGAVAGEVLTRVAAHYAISERVSEGKAAILGGVATGALTGLKADIAAGGMTLGGGAIIGSVIGALSAAGLARGYNLVRGLKGLSIQWSESVLLSQIVTLTLTYLAVAHFGRGRGEWARAEYPPHWLDVVDQAVADRRGDLIAIWKDRERLTTDGAASTSVQTDRGVDQERSATQAQREALERLSRILQDILWRVLGELYPPAVRPLERR